VDLIYPSISCSKTANPTSGAVGTDITYTLEVCNTGDGDLDLVSVMDTLLGDLTALFPATLPEGACHSIEVTRAIQVGDPNPLPNTVTFNYVVPVLGNVLTCQSTARVDIAGEACLIIFKFQDSNVNGVWDHGEPGLPGWKFRVQGNGYDQWVTTGPDGRYQLDNLVPGTYTITEEMKSGWYSTKPGGDPPYQQTVDVQVGAKCTEVEFGNREERREIPTQAPSMNDWGIIAMITLFAGMLVWTLRRRQLALQTE